MGVQIIRTVGGDWYTANQLSVQIQDPEGNPARKPAGLRSGIQSNHTTAQGMLSSGHMPDTTLEH